ncbi:MAG: helix-turn-helix domain-containing protein [Patescibacteria group bacterium]
MYREVLEEIGLSPNEAKIYEALLERGVSSVPALALKTGVDKRNIYDIIPKMLKKGIIYQIVDPKERLYAALEPAKLKELLREKESRLDDILPALNKKFRKSTTGESVSIYKGKEGFKNYLRDVLKAGKDVYFVGAKGGWFDPELETFIKHFLREAKKKGIKYHHLFDHEMGRQAPEVVAKLGKPHKFLPKEYSTTGAIDIFGDHVVTFSGLTLKSVTEDVTLVVIKNKELADCYRTWFQFMWDHCPETKG